MAADDYNIISKHGKTTTASAVSPNSIKRPKERVPAKRDMPEVNMTIICQLCSGYLIDATTITECLHTFCKSCILKYLEANSYCPVCDVQLNKGKPQLSLRSDVIMQRLVYKLVPGLLVSEIRRRRDFSIKQGIDYQEATELASNSVAEEIETASDLPTVLTLDDVVSLSVEYYRSGAGDKGSSADTASSTQVADTNGKQPQQQQSATTTTTTSGAASTTTQSSQNQQQQKSNASVKSSDGGSGGTGATPANANASTDSNSGNKSSTEQANDRRYLQCPAAVSVGLLKKFIRMKYGLSDDYRVDLLYNGDRDNILENDLTLVDVAFIFNWKNKEEPMNIHYRIFERPVKSVTVYAGMKRPAPSVMDEPPDDGASGPHNRSSMFSSSSAPSSKLPRLADNTSTSGNQGSVRNSNTSGKSTTTSAATPAALSSASSSSSTSASLTVGSLPSKSASNTASSIATSSSSTVASSSSTNLTTTSKVAPVASSIKQEKEEVEDDEDVDDDDEEDEEEDYEQVERKEHMKGIKSSRRLNRIKESMKRSVAVASSNSLRVHQVSSSRSHSTDTKGSNESERESARKENSLSNSSSNSKHNANITSIKKRGKSHDSVESKGKSGKVETLRLRVSSTSSTSSSDHTSDSSDNNQKHHHHQPLKLSISTSGVTPAVVSSSASVEKKEPLKLSLGSVLANKTGSKSPERKHHKHKHHHHHHHHKLRHRDKQGKGVTPSATVTNNSQKPLKLSFTLSPPSAAAVSSQNSSGNQSQKSKQSQESVEVKEQHHQQQQPPTTPSSSSAKGKPLAGMQNYNNSARTSASAHGHLNNISKSISVSVNTNASNNSGNTTNNTISSANNSSNKGNQQYGNKMLSPAELIPKNTGIEIQPTTIPISSSQISQQQQQQNSAMQTASSASGNNNSHKHSHPLLPDSVHVPKSVTLIPVNPNQMTGNSIGGGNSGTTMGKLNNSLNAGMTSSSGASSQEKGSSGSQGNQNRINTHTFTHPITNKSLHQITVTEVPPPQQKTSGNAVVVTTTSTTHSSISVSTSNPIEKVIANAANKPQFNGPGSMEITKIYCSTTSSSKDNPAKKLKDRKGLDISITGTGINVNVNKQSQNKLEEALRQKVNIAIGGGSGSISVTPSVQQNSNNLSLLSSAIGANSANNVNTGNKMKSVSAAAANLLSGKMPPGITIGPATVPSSAGSGNHNSNSSAGVSNASNMNSASSMAGNNIIKGLGFSLPPHLTAHPHIPNNMKMSHSNPGNNSQAKSDKINVPANNLNTNNSRLLGKDSISIIGKANVSTGGQQQQQPPPVEITISASGNAGNKSQTSITNNRGGISIVNKSKMSNDPLASIFDITQGLQRKSPSPTVHPNNATTPKDMKGMPTASGGGNNVSQQQQANKNANMANKRPFELVSIAGMVGGGTQGNNNSMKKLAKDSPEMKKSRSASTSSEPDRNKQPQQQQQSGKSSTGEIPLDLSGRSTRTTPPITIPHPREPSKSPHEKPRQSPERAEKPGIVINPSAAQAKPAAPSSNMNIPTGNNSLLSSKLNTPSQKNTTIPAITAEPFKGQSKPISVSKLSPNQTSKIGSIVDSLAQKQAQAQQQQHLQNLKNAQQQQQQHLQNLKNSQQQQQQQQQQHLQNLKNSQQQQQHHSHQQKQQKQQQNQQHSHPHHNPLSNTSSSLKTTSPNNSTHSSAGSGNKSNTSMKSSPGNNSNISTKGSPSSSGITSPISASPVIPMTSPSPPNGGGAGDHFRNLWALPDGPTNRQMNELLVAASLFSPPGHPHPLAGASVHHQLAAVAAAAAGASPSSAPAPGGSSGAINAYNSNLIATQLGHHIAALGAANKLPPGFFDPALAAAFSAHAGMRMQHPFVGSMSPPLNMPHAFFPPHGAPSAAAAASQQQQQQQASHAAGMKIPNVSSKQGSSPGGNSTGQPGKSPNSMPYSPLFSHSVPVSSPKSPNVASQSSSSASVKSPTSGSVLPFTAPSSMPGSNTVSNHTSNSNNTTISHDQKHSTHSHTSVSGKSSHHHQHHHHHHDSSSTQSNSSVGSASGNSKGTKINGTVSTAMPVFPPGIHNPLLPSRSSTTSSSSNSSGNGFQSGSSSATATTTALNKSFSALNKSLASSTNSGNSNKCAIPNSMKISNFLPNKPSDSLSDANAEATITSGSNVTSPRSMPPLQAKPTFSLSPTRTPASNLIPPSVNIPKNHPHPFNNSKEGSCSAAPISPVKGATGAGATNKPSSMTCASLLLPDSLYSKPSHHPTHHLLNSLSPTKGDHHHHQQQLHGLSSSSRLSSRTPSSDSALLSPSGSASTNKAASPGASISNKSHNVNTKDGFRSADVAHHHSNKSLSPTKEIITSKKEIGSIPTGPAAVLGLSGLGNRNFTASSSTPSVAGGLARPIPTIPAFLNRSSSASSNPIISPVLNLHNMPLVKDGLLQKSTSPGKSSSSTTSPVKVSNELQQQLQHPHLPLPGFPFPGVSVPVQVKLQDDGDVALPAVTSTVTTTTSLSGSLSGATSTHHGISLKSEVNKLLAAKEEKIEESRKRSCSLDQPPPPPSSSLSPKSLSYSSEPESSVRKSMNAIITSQVAKESSNSSEIPPPAKVQKIEMQAGITSSVKTENAAAATVLNSENKCSSESSNVCQKGTVGVKSESELLAQRESKVGEGERIEKASNEKKGDAVVVAGADPSKEIPISTPTNATCITTTAAATTALLATTSSESPCKNEAETPSPVKAVEVSVSEKVSEATAVPTFEQPPVLQSETQTKEKATEDVSCNTGSIGTVDITQEEKSTTQIAVDTSIPPKSDETSVQIEVNRQESKSSFEIPKGTESGQLTNNASVEGRKITDGENNDEDEQDVDVDIEMEKEAELAEETHETMGHPETKLGSEVEMDTVADEAGDNQMEIDVEANVEEKMDEPVEEKLDSLMEERVTLTKATEDEDIDVDVVDVGVDEPMEINAAGIRDSDEKEIDEDTEELCIDDGNESGAVVSSHHEDNERDSMETVQNDEVEAKNELIESPPENNNSDAQATCLLNDDDVNNAGDDCEDMTSSSEKKKDVEEEKAEEESKDSVEISPDVIKRQKVEETDTLSRVEEASTPVQVEQAMSKASLEEQERNEIQVESTFLAVNEASNFSQDDSECGDLIIDLGPNAGENEACDDDDDDHELGAEGEENNEKEAEELLTQEESNHSAVVQLEIKESEAEDTISGTSAALVVEEEAFICIPSQEAAQAKLNEEEPALSIMNSEAIEADQGEENHVGESPAGEQKDEEDDDIIGSATILTMESGEETTQPKEQQVAHVAVEALNQDSIPNQITINSPSIEVNGVIKSDGESEKREESENQIPENVAECPPQAQPGQNSAQDCATVSENSEQDRETETVLSGNFVAPEEDNKNDCEAVFVADEPSTVCGVMVESNSQLDEPSPVNDTTAEDNKNTADNNEVSSAVVDDKKIEEEQLEQQQQQQEGVEELFEIAMLPESSLSTENLVLAAAQENDETAALVEIATVIGDDDKTAPVQFLEQDNNVEDSENILGTDDSSVAQETVSLSMSAEDDAEKDMGTPMEIEENEMSQQVDKCEEMVVDMQVEQVLAAGDAETETSTVTVPEIDEEFMPMETDSISPPAEEESSTCVHSPQLNGQTLSHSETEETLSTPTLGSSAEDIVPENINSTEEELDVAVISATITTASAVVSSNIVDNSVVTPTTSTSSVAIKLDISANDNDDDAGKNAAASLLPSSVNNTTSAATTNSSSSLIIPSSNNTSASSSTSSSSCSSSSSSPVDVPATTTTGLSGIGSKSLETFGKVAAGLLASATSTINNNNNNTSLAPTTCDAISIATTNANA